MLPLQRKTLVGGWLIAGLAVGCGSGDSCRIGTEADVAVIEAAEPEVGVAKAESSEDDSKPAAKLIETSAAGMPELLIPPKTANAIDAEVLTVAAMDLAIPKKPAEVETDAASAAFTQLVEAYRAGRPVQWTQAETAIHDLGGKALPALLAGLAAGDSQTRELASMMLVQILPNLLYADDPSQQPDAKVLAEYLRPFLLAESVEVQANVAVALSLIDGEAVRLVPVFRELLDSELPHVRTMAVVALGGLGTPANSAIPTIERMSQSDPDANVKAAATEALNRLKPPK